MENTRQKYEPALVDQAEKPLNPLFRWVLWLLFLVLMLGLPTVQGQVTAPLPTKGRTFWLGYMQNAYGAQELRLMIASQNGTSGTVSIPRTGWSAPFTTAVNGVTTVIVPVINEHVGSEFLSDKGVLIQAQDSVTVSLASYQSFTTEAAQVLPLEGLGTSYRVQGYRGLSGFADFYKSELLVVATADDTQLEIVPSVNTSGGRPAGVPFTITLDAGQSFQVQSALASLDVTGTSVKATATSGPCRPFAVFGGSMCANVPAGCPACDHIVEQMIPTDRWGRNFHTIPMQGVSTHTYRILADQANTQVQIDGGAPITLGPGGSHLVNGTNVPVCITASLPVSVAQLMEGFNCAGAGDPSMIELMPDERITTSVIFATVASAQIAQHGISVVMPTAFTSSLLLDGTAVNTALFQPYPLCNSYSHAKVPVGIGTHRLASSSGFLAYAVGIGTGESYAFTLSSKAIAGSQNDSTLCTNGSITLNALAPITNAEWRAASAPTVVLATGASYTFTPSTNDSYTVTGELVGSACPYSFTYIVGLTVQPNLVLTADNLPAASICQNSSVQLNVSPVPNAAAFDLAWSPAALVSDPTIPDPVAYPQTNAWFKLLVTSPVGCGTSLDSVLVTVLPNSLMGVRASVNDSAICVGGTVQLSAMAEQVLASDALNGTPGALWTALSGANLSNVCGSVSGDALYFNNAGVREARTVGLNVSTGGKLRFALKVATGTAPCDNADPGEDVVLEYSINGGTNWITFATYSESAYPAFTPIAVSVPGAAQTTNTLFRWRQLANSGAGQDNWMLDDVMVTRYNNTGLNFTWAPSAGMSNANATNTTAAPTATTPYTITATGGAGCTAQDSLTVIVQPAFAITVSNDTALCAAGASAPLHAVPSSGMGISWSWTPSNGSLSSTSIPDPIATPLSTTSYALTATTNIGCTDNAVINVSVGTLNGLTVSAASSQLCAGSSTALNAAAIGTGIYTYAWSPSNGLNNANLAAPTATPTTTTTYTCTVTEPASGCQRSGTVTVTVKGPYSADAGTSDTLCSTLGYQLNVQHNVPAPFTITWSNAQFLNSASISAPSIMLDTTATYLVTVTDALGCTRMDSVTIWSAFDNLITPLNVSTCAGQPLLLDAGFPGSAYIWNTGATTQTIVINSAGTYTSQITDVQGCVTVANFIATVHPLVSVNLGADTNLCGATSYVLNANSPGNAILWSTGQTTQQITITQGSVYSVLATSLQGCQAGDAIAVAFNPMPTDVLQDVTTCISNVATLNAGNAGNTFAWSTGATTQTISPAQNGLYSVLVSTPQNCSATFNASVTYMPLIAVDLGNDTVLCSGQPISLDATNLGASYLWSNGATTATISPSQSGNYSINATNGYCQDKDTISVTFIPAPLDVLQDVTVCVTQSVTLNAGNPGCTYLWNTGETISSITAPASGSYSVSITNSTGCNTTADAVVGLVDPPLVDIGPDSVLCDGDDLLLHAGNPGSSYLWSTGNTAHQLTLVSSGNYSVTVNNGYCTATDAMTATFNPSPNKLSTRQYYTCLDEAPGHVVIDAENEGSDYAWSTGETSQIILAGAYGWYYVQISNIHDCRTKDSTEVIEFCPATLYIPNTFTPNGDGTNDIWLPVGKSIGDFSVQVFDRWGGVLFQSNDPNSGWDGRANGEYVKNDVYVWRMEYRFLENTTGTQGQTYKKLGHVTVMR